MNEEALRAMLSSVFPDFLETHAAAIVKALISLP